MKKLTVLTDYDDVLFPLIPAWVHRLNIMSGTNLSIGDITDWKIARFYPMLTEEEVFSPLHENDFWNTLKPFESSIECLSKIHNDGHIIKVVTATFCQDIRPKMECLFHYYPFITWNQVTITSDKQGVKGDVLIDDAPHNLEGGDYFKILVNTPHNKKYDAEKNGMVRVVNLDEAYPIICSLSNVM